MTAIDSSSSATAGGATASGGAAPDVSVASSGGATGLGGTLNNSNVSASGGSPTVAISAAGGAAVDTGAGGTGGAASVNQSMADQGLGGAATVGSGGSTTATAGGSSGAGASNLGQAGAPSGDPGDPCSSAALAFCDDFEDHALGDFLSAAPWSTHFNGEGTIQVDDSMPAHSGTKSVRVDATGYQTFFVLSGAPAFPATNGRLYVRTFMRLSEALSAGHNTFFEAGPAGNTDPPFETRVGVMFSMLMINQPDADRGFLSNENYYIDNLLGAEFPAETWACIEALFDSPNSEVNIWLDGVEVSDLHRTDWQQDPVEELRFGYEKYAGPNTQIWYDDIAVSSAPIGCE